ncbi:hypothetical protein TIFTF001_052563 [Ficus carica]|uniref:Uncharacterized protein n=1 Tax=Ficus carica TaxID=3494 RepID=A0AA88EMY8_FICCA|nr:hypothetical protein TIFTF001_052557 [Ficus carica]GMN75106.1 hypothetical protein TIFTF001_052559 [Ficus carica]GMN75107.1 hypothetical protein TIFTF001_052561 [Ficus carica]GMN75109.1 hypothetical protein TIFTF001_052563 [Ficus carica]
MRDRHNCGKCGKKCKYNQICCNGNCVNPSFNKRHCGGCNNRFKYWMVDVNENTAVVLNLIVLETMPSHARCSAFEGWDEALIVKVLNLRVLETMPSHALCSAFEGWDEALIVEG